MPVNRNKRRVGGRTLARKLPSIARLAQSSNPLEALNLVVRRLFSASVESQHLEWKLCSLFGPGTTVSNKYRSVKAAISFANADGGFLLLGIGPNGAQLGLPDAQIAEFDPAKVTELISGVVYPDLPAINCAQFRRAGKNYIVIHIPPSPLVPHSTTKDIADVDASGNKKVILSKHIVYYRCGAKSDSATPLQLQRIVEKRTQHVHDELLRRVREVKIPVLKRGHSVGSTSGTAIAFTRSTSTLTAPAVRLTRGLGKTSGVFLHEELSDGLFDEINNILDANKLLAGVENKFLFSEEIYYRIYAERHHVQPSSGHGSLMLKIACSQFYAPLFFWLTIVPHRIVAEELIRAVTSPKSPLVNNALRAFVLLGEEATLWLNKLLDRSYKKLPQPPEFYWTFKKIIEKPVTNRSLMAMRTKGTAILEIPDSGNITISQLLSAPSDAAGHLSKICMNIFKGNSRLRALARQLDIIAYGKQVEKVAPHIWGEIRKLKKV